MKQTNPSQIFSLLNILLILSFSLSIFMGSFLLFQVQPIISKYILPWFGGASAVWITAMLFFQIFLLLGYFYVFLISKLTLRKQIFLHTIVLLLVALPIFLQLMHASIPILPSISQKLPDTDSPILQVLQILFISTALPYLVLSTTSILLQKWFGSIHPQKSPYLFYALSNAASLLAIISYPFWVEPTYTLLLQGKNWSIGFLIYALVLLLACIFTFLQFHRLKKSPNHTPPLIHNSSFLIPKHQLALWILLPAISSLMLLAITNLLTQSVASVPFLWLLPLSLYLISFIICFSGSKWYWQNFYAYLFLGSGFLAMVFTRTDIPSVLSGIIIYALTLFSACMLYHGQLYRLRPHSDKLDRYYLCIAFGSALSGILVGIIAPLFFNGIWEIYIGFYLTFLLAIAVLIHYKNSFLSRHLAVFASSQKEIYLAATLCFPIVLIGLSLFTRITSGYDSVNVWRSFYGILTVSKKTVKNQSVTYLKHGNIVHGDQFSGVYKREPTTYFARNTGIGLVLSSLEKQKSPLHMGIIGLGAGTLAAYGRKGDTITFYELNPQVVQIANTEFSYLRDSPAKITVVTGDGRLSLERESSQMNPQRFDILVVDAFSDDAIPLHLLTKEAFLYYYGRMSLPNGILAFHISNNYLDLKPVLVRMAEEFGFSYVFIHTKANGIAAESEWAFLTYNQKFLTNPAIYQAILSPTTHYKDLNLWTDQNSNLFKILK